MNYELTETVSGLSRDVADYGALVVLASVYILFSAAMMVAAFRWFRSLADRIVSRQDGLEPIAAAIRENSELMRGIAEGLRPETLLRVRNLTGFAFDLSVEQVCRLIKRVREENHIADRQATANKVRKALAVMHSDRNSRFDTFSYGGTPLSAFCSPEWVDRVARVVEAELYHPDGPNNARAFTNVRLAYDEIKTDFYNRIAH